MLSGLQKQFGTSGIERCVAAKNSEIALRTTTNRAICLPSRLAANACPLPLVRAQLDCRRPPPAIATALTHPPVARRATPSAGSHRPHEFPAPTSLPPRVALR